MFLNIFKELLNERGINQYKLSELTNIPLQTIYNWTKRNSLPNAEYLIKLADYFQVSTDYLLGRENDIGVININANLTPYQNELLSSANKLSIQDQHKVLGYIQALIK